MFQRSTTLHGTFRKFRISHHLTQKTLAHRLGVSENYLWMIENGLRTPSPHLTKKFGMLFDANPFWLISLLITLRISNTTKKANQIFDSLF